MKCIYISKVYCSKLRKEEKSQARTGKRAALYTPELCVQLPLIKKCSFLEWKRTDRQRCNYYIIQRSETIVIGRACVSEQTVGFYWLRMEI